MSLLHLLELLARPNGVMADRQAAADALGRRLAQIAPGMVKGLPVGDDVIEDARQHLLLKASVGTSRFRGGSEGEAYRWCQAVLTNHILSELRKAKKTVSMGDDERGVAGVSAAPPGPGAYATLEARCNALVKKLIDFIPNLHRAAEVANIADNVRCYVEASVLELSAEDQLETWGFRGPYAAEGPDDPLARKRALQRIYQNRRRGGLEWRKLVGALRTCGGLTPDDLDVLRDILPGEEF